MAAEISTSDRPNDSWMTLKTLPLHRNQVLVQKRQAKLGVDHALFVESAGSLPARHQSIPFIRYVVTLCPQ